MKAGRPRKPISELKLSGMYKNHAERQLWNTETPSQMGPEPAPTKYLQRTRDAWTAFMQVKAQQGILSIEDKSTIVQMFDALDLYYRITDKIFEFYKDKYLDTSLETKDGRAEIKAMTQLQRTYLNNWIQLACRFGITPTERSKLQIPSETSMKAKNELLKLIEEA